MSESPSPSVTISQRSRPLRFGYLLHSFDDAEGLRNGIQLFTSLWGGMYCGFVPVYRQLPSWWNGPSSGADVTHGYLDAFEPDFLIVDSKDLAGGLGYEGHRVLRRSELVREDGFSHGIGAHELFAWLWEEDFQYVKREPPEVVLPRTDQSAFKALVATCFGQYPAKKENRPDYESRYRRVFDATDLLITAEQLLRLHLDRAYHPLNVGVTHLDVRPGRWSSEPLLFVLDSTSTLDLVDFWNLRALGRDPIPVPIQWFDKLREGIALLVEQSHRPHHFNTNLILGTRVMRGRSLTDEQAGVIEEGLRLDSSGGLSFQRWYPRIWDAFGRDHDHGPRAEVTALRDETQVIPSGERITFRACPLPMKTRYSPHRRADSVRVIRVRDYLDQSSIASVIPLDLESARPVLESFSLDDVWFSSEGIVATSNGTDRFLWKVPRGAEVCRSWLAQHGFELEVTSGGKLLHEAIQRLGGLNNTRILTRQRLTKLLNRMAGRPGQPAKTYPLRDLVGNSADHENGDDRALAELSIRQLVRRQVLEVGAALDCEHCGQGNWYKLDQLRSSLRCDRCLQDFDFPATNPPSDPWRYRTIGPFAVENYIQGGVSVLLSIRLLASTGAGRRGDRITWCPSFKLKRNDGNCDEIEVDAMAFVEQHEPYTGSVSPVFVEGKSYGKRDEDRIFGDGDILNMRRIGESFPGAVLVFATLNSRLKQADIDVIKPLAEDGRHPIAHGHWKNAVVVLTGRELFSEFGPPGCWEKLGETEEFANMNSVGQSLYGLADATQRLYLGMEPYSEYIERRIRNVDRT